jgi:hypothetical protein
MLTKKAAEAALASLLGMGLDYSPTLDRHDVRCKVGVITSADIVGRNIELGGYLYARDFPEIVQEIAKSGRGGGRRSLESCREQQEPARTLHAGVGQSNRWTEGYRLRSSLRDAAADILRLRTKVWRGEQAGQSYRPTIRAEAGVAMGGTGGLGLSYEVTDVQLTDSRAQVWTLEKVTFTGAAILRRDKAAYQDTWIELGT